MTTLERRRRITGPARDKLAGELKARYEGCASIRALAESIGRSYGFVQRLLEESGTPRRSRGGSIHGRLPAR